MTSKYWTSWCCHCEEINGEEKLTKDEKQEEERLAKIISERNKEKAKKKKDEAKEKRENEKRVKQEAMKIQNDRKREYNMQKIKAIDKDNKDFNVKDTVKIKTQNGNIKLFLMNMRKRQQDTLSPDPDISVIRKEGHFVRDWVFFRG